MIIYTNDENYEEEKNKHKNKYKRNREEKDWFSSYRTTMILENAALFLFIKRRIQKYSIMKIKNNFLLNLFFIQENSPAT